MVPFRLPSAFGILALLLLVVAVGITAIPSGSFERLSYDADAKQFSYFGRGGTVSLSGTQKSLDSLGVRIPLKSFEEGAITKPIAVPGTYSTQSKPSFNWLTIFLLPIKGLQAAADVVFFVLIIGGFIGVVQKTGALDAAMQSLSQKLGNRSWLLIVTITTLSAIGGTTFGMAEELIAFIPLLIPVFAAAGYNGLLAMSCLFLGSALGTAVAISNPFSTIIASDAAGTNWIIGSGRRSLVFVLGLMCTIGYLLWYGKKSRLAPQATFQSVDTVLRPTLGWRTVVILLVFAASFVTLVVGVAYLQWWFTEMTAIFLAGALLIGFLASMGERSWLQAFMAGVGDMVSVAFIIGLARGISILLEEQLVSDTVLNYAASRAAGYSGPTLLLLLMGLFALLSFFIPSTSGLAVLTMPLFAPLSDAVAIDRSYVVDAYLYGQGLFNVINPTSLILMYLAAAQESYPRYLKMVWPLLLMLTLLFGAALVIIL